MGCDHLRRRMIGVTGHAFARDFALRAVAGHAVRFHRHEHIRRFAALGCVVACVAGDGRVFGVIKMRASHPTVDQHRFGDGGNERGLRFHFVTKGAAIKCRARAGDSRLRFVGIDREEDAPLEFFT